MKREMRNHLVEEHQDLVKRIALNVWRKIPPSAFDYDDLVGWGQVGLIEAADNYSGTPEDFRIWAFLRIRGAMIDGMRSMDMFPRSLYETRRNMRKEADGLTSKLGRNPTHGEVAEALDVTDEHYRMWASRIRQMEDFSAEPAQETEGYARDIEDIHAGGDDFEKWCTSDDVMCAMRLLHLRERTVMYCVYWLGYTHAEVAELMGVQSARVSQIRMSAIVNLRKYLGNYEGD